MDGKFQITPNSSSRLPVTRAFLFALVLLAGIELIVRIGFQRNMSGRFDYGYHPIAGFVDQSDGRTDLVRAGGRRFHKQSYSTLPPQGTRRLIVVGDSVPRGGGVASAYPWLTAQFLTSEGVGTFEGWNLGVPGYGARRNLLVLKKALEYRPNVMVFHVNDSNEYEDEREWRRATEFRSWHVKNWPMKSLALRRVYEAKTEKVFWEMLPLPVRNQSAVRDADAEVSASMDPETLTSWRQRVLQGVLEAVKVCANQEIPLVLIIQCRFNPGSGELENLELSDAVKALGVESDSVRILPMSDVFQGTDLPSMFSDGAHLRPAGHQHLAKSLSKIIQLLPTIKNTSQK